MTDWSQLRQDAIFATDVAVVLNKPAGISVVGERHETDIARLAKAEGVTVYPAHRIDKVTSGAVLLALDLPTHGELTRQFARRTVDKTYLALTRSNGLPEHGVIDLPLSVGRKSRIRIAAPRERIVAAASTDPTSGSTTGRWTVAPGDVLADTRVYPSTTTFTRLWADERHTLLAVHPLTGRRHQIRVHLAWVGHALVGDPLFDQTAGGARTCLHSWRLAFDAPWAGGARLTVTAVPGDDFWAPVRERLPAGGPAALLARAEAGRRAPE